MRAAVPAGFRERRVWFVVVAASALAAAVITGALVPDDDQGSRESTPRATASTPVTGPRYYVSVSGSDTGPGTLSRPWRTLGHALEQLSPGDTLLVGAGTYREDLEPQLTAGAADRRITVRRRGRERPVVRGLVRFEDPDYWTVEGLDFTWQAGDFDDHMVKVSGGTGWVLDDVHIYGSRSRAGLLIAASIESGPPHDYTVVNSAVYDSRRGANLYLNPGLGSTGGTIEGNLFFNSPTENVKVGFGGGCKSQSNPLFGAADVVVRYNTLVNGGQPLTIAEPAERITVHHNIVVGGRRGMLLRLDGECANLGAGIRVFSNVGARAQRWCEDYASPVECRHVDEGGNLFPYDPQFSGVGPEGFRPHASRAVTYGHLALTR